ASVLANDLEHPVTLVRIRDEAFVDERLQRVEIGATDLLAGVQCPASAKGSQSGERVFLVGGQQVVAPIDSRAERLLALGQVARTAGQKCEPLLQARQDLGRGKRSH